jgi:hypothetical protein
MKPITDPLALARQAVADYRQCYGNDLVSIILYGSAASGDFDPARSDINLLIVLSVASVALMEKSLPVQAAWAKKRFPTPLFMDKAYIASSLDSFPVEFLNMKSRYTLLAGEDVLEGLSISGDHLRLQIERELKGKRLHLLQEWLHVRQHRHDARELMDASLRDYSAIFRALLQIRSIPVPADRPALFRAIEQAFGLGDQPFSRMYSALRQWKKKEAETIFYAYAEALMKITDVIDKQHS